MLQQLQSNLRSVQDRIAAACERAGRDPKGVKLIAVTKYVGAEVMDALVELGVTDLGENRLQVAAPKLEAMRNQATMHYIGPLQTNKVKQVLGLFASVHSLDRMSLAEAIQSRAEQSGIESYPCFVEVNIASESAKSGFAPSQVFAAMRQIHQSCPRIQLAGLMCIPPATDQTESTRQHFRMLRKLRDNAVAEGFIPGPFDGLSMGMSNDFEVAVEEGATHVRVGSLLYQGLP